MSQWEPTPEQVEAGALELARLRDHRVGASSTHPGQYAVYFYPSEDYWTECGPYASPAEAAGAIPDLLARAVLQAAFEGTVPVFLTPDEIVAAQTPEHLLPTAWCDKVEDDDAEDAVAARLDAARSSLEAKLDAALKESGE